MLLLLLIAPPLVFTVPTISIEETFDTFISNEIRRLVYASASQGTVYYDEQWVPRPALRDIVTFCNKHPEFGLKCTLQLKEEKQENLGSVWTEFHKNCKPNPPDPRFPPPGPPSFTFVSIQDMTPRQLKQHLSPGYCDQHIRDFPVPRFNVRTSITVDKIV